MKNLSLTTFITGTDDATFLVQVTHGQCTLLADLEYWEECPTFLDEYPIRIELYGHDGWALPLRSLSPSITETVSEERGQRCGDIYFQHELDRSGASAHEEFFWMALRRSTAEAVPLHILELNQEDVLPDVISTVQDGVYIIYERFD